MFMVGKMCKEMKFQWVQVEINENNIQNLNDLTNCALLLTFGYEREKRERDENEMTENTVKYLIMKCKSNDLHKNNIANCY